MSNGGYNAKGHLGAALRQARKARGLRQEDVGKALGTDARQIRRWESGKTTPSGLALVRLLQFFREHADQPDLETLIRAIQERPAEDLDSRIAELGQRIKHDPWLLERIDRLLLMTDQEWRGTIEYIDQTYPRQDDHQPNP